MPSRWAVTDPEQKIAKQFDQKILAKMISPVNKIVLAMLDSMGKEVYRLADARTSIPGRILGLGPDEWAIVSGDKPVAKLGWLPRQTSSANGFSAC